MNKRERQTAVTNTWLAFQCNSVLDFSALNKVSCAVLSRITRRRRSAHLLNVERMR